MISCINKKSVISRNSIKDFYSFIQKPETIKFLNNEILYQDSY